MVYLQLVLGALMRHMGAGLAIPDFPLAFGRLVPPLETSAVVVHFLHRLGALAVTLCVGWLMARILRQYRAKKRLLRPALLLAGLVLLQLTLGALTIWTRRAVLQMTAHVAVGAAVLATSVVIALRAVRLTAARPLEKATEPERVRMNAKAQIGGPLSGPNRKTLSPCEPYCF
jgi:cytochrome c oxidase assembly protein subunit 15